MDCTWHLLMADHGSEEATSASRRLLPSWQRRHKNRPAPGRMPLKLEAGGHEKALRLAGWASPVGWMGMMGGWQLLTEPPTGSQPTGGPLAGAVPGGSLKTVPESHQARYLRPLYSVLLVKWYLSRVQPVPAAPPSHAPPALYLVDALPVPQRSTPALPPTAPAHQPAASVQQGTRHSLRPAVFPIPLFISRFLHRRLVCHHFILVNVAFIQLLSALSSPHNGVNLLTPGPLIKTHRRFPLQTIARRQRRQKGTTLLKRWLACSFTTSLDHSSSCAAIYCPQLGS